MPAYDQGVRRKVQSPRGRDKGVYLYVPLEELRRLGFKGDSRPTRYRFFGASGGSLIVRFYRKDEP